MSFVQAQIALAHLAVMLLTANPTAAQSVEERLISKLAAISAETDQRTAAFMSEIAPRQAALRLGELSTPHNLASREGRSAIRTGYLLFAKIIDDMDAFDRAEEVRVSHALSGATTGFPPEIAMEAQSGFKRGYARMSARHAVLRAAQRESIRVTLELVDLIDRAPGVSIVSGQLNFLDRETETRVSRLLSELGRLEMEEQRAEQEIMKSRRPTPQSDRRR